MESSYFWAIGAACAVLVVLVTVMPGPQRQVTLFSGLMHAPAGGLAILFGGYWTPNTLFDLKPGLEDFMFNFAAGLSTWLLVALWSAGRRVRRVGPWRLVLGRLALIYSVTTAAFLGWLWIGNDPLAASIAAMLLVAVAVLALRPQIWRLAVPAAVLYPVMHGLALALAFRIWPDLPMLWPEGAFWSMAIWFGIPFGEIAWAFCYGAFAPLAVAMALEGRS